MKCTCRHLLTSLRRRRQRIAVELLRHASIVTDPETLSYLNTEVKKQIANSKFEGRNRRHKSGSHGLT